MKKIEQILSENLVSLRKERGFKTQEKLAEAAGLSFRGYQDIERGLSWPRPENLRAIADALRVRPFRLFIEAGESPEPTIGEAVKIIIDFVKKHDNKLD